jgi:SAM-dependent methyltransferase
MAFAAENSRSGASLDLKRQMPTLREQFGEIDIYLFDQLLKGRITPGMTIVDAGCGSGRNIVYLLREGYEVFGCDTDAREVDRVRELARKLAPSRPAANFVSQFRVEPVQKMSFESASADVALCNTVLHFAQDDADFTAMVDELWRILKPGGLLFTRLGSTIGMETLVERIQGRRYQSPDGSERYLVDAALLAAHTDRLGAALAEPIKTTVVQNLRAMTTWVLRKT